MSEDRVRRINIPIPNPGLGEWLKGPQCRAAVERVTAEVAAIYENSLPIGKVRDGDRHPGLLKASVSWHVGPGGWGADQDRWFGYVTNSAEYAAVIEYGKGTRPGQHQLRNAAAIVAGGVTSLEGVNIPGLSHAPQGRGSTLRGARGRFVRNPLAQDAPRRRRP